MLLCMPPWLRTHEHVDILKGSVLCRIVAACVFAIVTLRCLVQPVRLQSWHTCCCSTLPFRTSRQLLFDGLQEQQEEAVQRRDHAEARQWRKRLHHYLDWLFRADQTAAADLAELQVRRCTALSDSCSQDCNCRQLHKADGGQVQLTLRSGITCLLHVQHFCSVFLCPAGGEHAASF